MKKRLVLIVEDEPLIRLVVASICEEAGYEVIEASNADEAIEQLETKPEIGAVVSDIEMPGSMDGLKLIHAVRGRWPPVTLILVSGGVSPAIGDMPSKTIFLQKPYSEAALLGALGSA